MNFSVSNEGSMVGRLTFAHSNNSSVAMKSLGRRVAFFCSERGLSFSSSFLLLLLLLLLCIVTSLRHRSFCFRNLLFSLVLSSFFRRRDMFALIRSHNASLRYFHNPTIELILPAFRRLRRSPFRSSRRGIPAKIHESQGNICEG